MSIFSHRLYFTTFGVKISVFTFSLTNVAGCLIPNVVKTFCCILNFRVFQSMVTPLSLRCQVCEKSPTSFICNCNCCLFDTIFTSLSDLILTIIFSKNNRILIQKIPKAFLLIACMLQAQKQIILGQGRRSEDQRKLNILVLREIQLESEDLSRMKWLEAPTSAPPISCSQMLTGRLGHRVADATFRFYLASMTEALYALAFRSSQVIGVLSYHRTIAVTKVINV